MKVYNYGKDYAQRMTFDKPKNHVDVKGKQDSGGNGAENIIVEEKGEEKGCQKHCEGDKKTEERALRKRRGKTKEEAV